MELIANIFAALLMGVPTLAFIAFIGYRVVDLYKDETRNRRHPPQPEPSMPPIPSAAEYNQHLLNEWEQRLYDEMVKDGGVMHGPKMVASARDGDWVNYMKAFYGANPVLTKATYDSMFPSAPENEAMRWLRDAERVNEILDRAIHE